MSNKPSNIVSIDNKLAQASYSLSLTEQRLLYILLSKIKPSYFRKETKQEVEDKVFSNKGVLKEDLLIKGDMIDCTTLFQLSVKEYATFCEVDMKDAREALIEAATHLLNRKVHLKKEDGSLLSFNWLQGIEYEASSDTISLRWSYYILPYIQNLTSYFTKLRLNELLGLRSTYSWKLYQLLLSKRGENIHKKSVEISYEDILFILAVPESCKEFKVFNSKILQRSMGELVKQKLFEGLVVEKILNCRRVIGLKFSWLGIPKVKQKKLIN
jgi:plasmid replication initiation protein